MPLTSKSRFYIIALFILLLTIGFSLSKPAMAQSTIDLAVHFVEGTPAEDVIAYQVKVFLSVLDNSGNPIKNLTSENFTVSEDAQQVQIESVELATDEPINVVLVLDTSGSMGGIGIDSARKAASGFISSLQEKDQIAILTFDNGVKTVMDFSNDHATANSEIQRIQSTSGAGTCLIDAAYQAAQLSASLPVGRRAVVLFTDGVDETSSGGVCSTNAPEDVIRLAAEGGTRVPIYTLSMGNRADTKTMERFALQTGGRYLHSSDASQLGTVFAKLSEQLRSQYTLQYKSEAGPGAHTLAVTARYQNIQDNDTRNFLLPNFPTSIFFTSPDEDDEINKTVTLRVDVFGQSQGIQQVVFEVNGKEIGSDTSTPYEVEADLSGYDAGDLTFEAIAQGPDGIEIDRTSRTLKFAPEETVEEVVAEEETVESNLPLTIGLSVLGFLLLAGGIAAFIILRRRREERVRDEEWRKATEGSLEDDFLPVAGSDMTMDSWEISSDALGMLTVIASDDATLIGQRFEITQATTTFGRSADNDINFPKDSPVSRRHAKIEEKSGGLFLSQVEAVDSSGKAKTPTYGTFINEVALESDPVMLQTGDEIRLGKRVRLRFEAGEITARSEELTYDGLATHDHDDFDSEKTIDQ